MEKSNLFWSVYKNLEKEVLDLTYSIHFTDDGSLHIKVYSVKIVELLIRCAVEIEAISKALYKDEGGDINSDGKDSNGEYVKYDFNCLKLLDKKWALGKKQILISAPSMYFKRNENQILYPLKNAHKGERSWQKAYQAIKHSRVENLFQASVKNLIHTMSALYLLNVYYKNDKIDVSSIDKNQKDVDTRLGSEIFLGV